MHLDIIPDVICSGETEMFLPMFDVAASILDPRAVEA